MYTRSTQCSLCKYDHNPSQTILDENNIDSTFKKYVNYFAIAKGTMADTSLNYSIYTFSHMTFPDLTFVLSVIPKTSETFIDIWLYIK